MESHTGGERWHDTQSCRLCLSRYATAHGSRAGSHHRIPHRTAWEQCLVRPGSVRTPALTMLGILGVKGAQKARLGHIFPDWIVDTLDQARNTEHKEEGGHLHA